MKAVKLMTQLKFQLLELKNRMEIPVRITQK